MKHLIYILTFLISFTSFSQTVGDTRENSRTGQPQIYDGTRWLTDWNSLKRTPFISVTSEGELLEVGKKYVMNGFNVQLPAATDDAEITVFNNATTKPGMRYNITGDLKDLDNDLNLSGFPVPPNTLFRFVGINGRWTLASDNFNGVVGVTSADANTVLKAGPIYEIENFTDNFVLKLSPFPAGNIKIFYTGNSTGSVRIEQNNLTDPIQQIRYVDEFGKLVVNNHFLIDPNKHRGKIIELVAVPTVSGSFYDVVDPAVNLTNSDTQPWLGNTPYVTGDTVIENRLSDGTRVIYERINPGTSRPTFDATEEIEWLEIGLAPVNIPILETIEMTFRGYFSSFTTAQNIVLIDKGGLDYASTDWAVIEDSNGTIPSGTSLFGLAAHPPVNGSRTIKIQYTGTSQRNGLSGVRVQFRADATSTGMTSLVAKYFNGVTQVASTGASRQGLITIPINNPDGYEFITRAELDPLQEENYGNLPLGGSATLDEYYFANAPPGTEKEIEGNLYLVQAKTTTIPNPLTAAFWDDTTNMIVVGQSENSETDIPDWTAGLASNDGSILHRAGLEYIAPAPINSNAVDNDGAIVGVNYIWTPNTDRPNTVENFDDAEADANWTLVGLFRVSGTDDRVMTGTGTMYLDPLGTLSNATNEFIHWTTFANSQDVLLPTNASFITEWQDYTGNNIPIPVGANQTFTIPENSQMWVHRRGNAIQISFESNEGGGSGTMSDLLIGDLFYSTSNEVIPGKLYQGETYNWSDNPKLQAKFNAQGHGFITDNGDGSFTIASHTDFLRAGVGNIGNHVDDTTAPNGLDVSIQLRRATNTSTGGGAHRYQTTGTFVVPPQNVTITGDSETAPNHRNAYFGIYGDISKIVVDANLVEVQETIASNPLAADEEVVSLDGIQVRMSFAQRQMQIRAASGTIEIQGNHSLHQGTAVEASVGTKTLTTAWQNLDFTDETFSVSGAQEWLHFRRIDTDVQYLVRSRLGGAFTNNSIIFERLTRYSVIKPEDFTITNPNGIGQLIGNGDNTATFNNAVNNGGTLYNQANINGTGISTTVQTLADIGFVLQPGDEIMLQTNLGVAYAIWRGTGTGTLGSVTRNDGVSNSIVFTQSGTILRFQGQNANGTRQWLKIVR